MNKSLKVLYLWNQTKQVVNGHDSISNKKIKASLPSSSSFLVILFNKIQTQIYPGECSSGIITITLKTRIMENPDNYRGIKINICLSTLFRCSHQSYSIKKGVLNNFAKFTGKLLCQSIFFTGVFHNLKTSHCFTSYTTICFPEVYKAEI